jgi:hypothetical protein
MFKFQADKIISELILLHKWSRNAFNTEDDAYKTPIFAYSRELDVLVLASSIIKSNVEEESSPAYLEDAMIDLKEETTNLENTTPIATPQSTMGSNEVNDPLMPLGSA